MTETWTVRKVLGWTAPHFEKCGVDAPRLTAEVLLAHVLGVDRVRLYVDLDRPLDPKELATYRALIQRRKSGEPLQYLTGVRDFFGRPFEVDARVLIPRPETELLAEGALAALPKDADFTALDLCTGSGCIAVTLAAERQNGHVWAVDLAPGACAVARKNAARHGVADRVEILEGDLFGPLPPDVRFDLVVSNPPYIASAEIPHLQREVLREPRLALDGGTDGLEVVRRIAEGARDRLRPSGLLALELGETQGPTVRAMLEQAGWQDVRIERDLERRDRLAFALQPGAPRASE